MKRPVRIVCLSLLVFWPVLAHSFEKQARFPLAASSRLRVELPVGELRVLGSSAPFVTVRLRVEPKRGDIDELERQIDIRFRPGSETRLDFTGMDKANGWFHRADVFAEVHVPSQTNLRAELGVGELRIQGVAGDLQIHVGVGELRVEVLDPTLYNSVRANAGIGEVQHPFRGASHGWLGKEFHGGYPEGRYRLEASVGVGEVRITEANTI